MDRPKGFHQYGVSISPIKQGSRWSAGVFNESLGKAMANSTITRYQGWLVCKNYPYIGTGKDLYIDFAMFASPAYFDFTGANDQKIGLYIKFYSMINQRFDGHWMHLGDYPIGQHGASLPMQSNRWGADGLDSNAAKYIYDTYYNCYKGAHKPAYGITKTYGVSLQPTYREYVIECEREDADKKAGVPTTWDLYNNSSPVKAFVNTMPFGVRYISHNGYWGPGKRHVDFNGTIKSDGYVTTMNYWSQQQEDCGSAGALKHLLITENMIRQAHGKVAGVTAFQLRFTFHSTNGVPNEWIWPSNDSSSFAKIDNPQVGLLDYGPKGSPAGWPPRFDAKAVQLISNGRRIDLQAKYAPTNGTWGIF